MEKEVKQLNTKKIELEQKLTELKALEQISTDALKVVIGEMDRIKRLKPQPGDDEAIREYQQDFERMHENLVLYDIEISRTKLQLAAVNEDLMVLNPELQASNQKQ